MTEFLVSESTGPIVPIHAIDEDGFPQWSAEQPERVRAWANVNGFSGKTCQVLLVPAEDGAVGAVLLGLGRREDPLAASALADSLPEGTYAFDHVAADWPLELLAGAFAYSQYTFEGAPGAKRTRRLLVKDAALRDRLNRIAAGTYLTRDLVNTPANDLGPEELEHAAADLARQHGADLTVTTGQNLREEFPMIHAVGRASTRAPRLIDLVWGKTDAPTVTLVGKGVCFDTGGLDLKPADAMLLMKKDMGGAAHVLGLAHMIMAMQVPVRLRVLIPAVENSVNGDAFRPGDVLPTRKGLKIEIGNTDAEGRLVLADALTYADEEKPDLIIDMATLTGAARFALGPDLAPYYTNRPALAAALEQAAEKTADPVWRMPLHQPYLKWLEPKVGDLNNIAPNFFAGSVVAAVFLEKFVSDTTDWMHFDIFAWNPSRAPGRPVGAAAQGIRALYDMLEDRYRIESS